MKEHQLPTTKFHFKKLQSIRKRTLCQKKKNVADLQTTQKMKKTTKSRYTFFTFQRILIHPMFWSSISSFALHTMLQPVEAVLKVRRNPYHVSIQILLMISVEDKVI